MKTVVYPGSFNPITKGHIDIVERSSRLFDRVIVAIAYSEKKQPLFSLEERVEQVKISLAHLNNIEVCGFTNLTTRLVREHGAIAVVRGVRSMADFEYERQLADMNRNLDRQFETLFLTPSENLSHISSTLVREIASMHGDVSEFVHPAVNAALLEKFGAE